MVVVILCFFIVAGISFVGYSFSCYYKKRTKFFSDYLDFLNHAKTQILCFQTRRSNIFNGFDAAGSDFENLIKNVLEKDNLKRYSYISESEWENVVSELKNIGKTDVENECNSIEVLKTKVVAMHEKAERESEKKSPLCIKLSVALGVFIAIIII